MIIGWRHVPRVSPRTSKRHAPVLQVPLAPKPPVVAVERPAEQGWEAEGGQVAAVALKR
jgi:hypothetical protein